MSNHNPVTRAEIRAQWEATGQCAAPTTGPNGYQMGCRCGRCTDGHRARMQEQRERRSVLREEGKMPARAHGASGYANWGCRCMKCLAGHSKRYKRWRAANLEVQRTKENDRQRDRRQTRKLAKVMQRRDT